MQNIRREDISIIMWLFSGCFLIFTMVIVGGVTRLTGSGLSMVDWKLFMGAIPPLNHQELKKGITCSPYQILKISFSGNTFTEYLEDL
jgi:hypothetical protein